MFSFIKNAVKNSLNLGKSFLFLGELNARELNGVVGKATRFKLMPHTSVRVPFSLGRTIRGVSFSVSSTIDPFGVFCKRTFDGEKVDNLTSYLGQLYKEEACLSAGEAVGLPDNILLSKYPAWALVMPWESIALEEKYRTYLRDFVKNRFEHGAEFTVSRLSDPARALYSEENARSQVLQTKRLLQSIQLKGFLPIRPLPQVLIMYSDSEWRWCLSNEGNHRGYLAFIYGQKQFDAYVQGIINSCDVRSWNNVKNGTYSEKEALQIFDYFFTGIRSCRGVV
jgi:hypothetical protein